MAFQAMIHGQDAHATVSSKKTVATASGFQTEPSAVSIFHFSIFPVGSLRL